MMNMVMKMMIVMTEMVIITFDDLTSMLVAAGER